MELFDEADLDLPGVTFVRYDSPERCFGRRGAHIVEDGRSVIRICNDDVDRSAERVMLHELAHAWDRHVVDRGTAGRLPAAARPPSVAEQRR